MAEHPDERAMVEADKLSLERARKQVRRKKKKTAGDRQIAERLDEMAEAPDLDDPQRYHGS